MGKREWLTYTSMAITALCAGCFDSSDGPQTGGHTNWLACEVVEDCAAVPDAVDCTDAVCVDAMGEPIPEPVLETVPADWVPVETACGFRYMAPPEVRNEFVQGIDSCVDRFVTSDCVYEDGHGAFDTEFGDDGWLGVTTESLEVDGQTGTLTRAIVPHDQLEAGDPAYLLFVYLPRDASDLYGTFLASCMSPQGLAEARQTVMTLQRPR